MFGADVVKLQAGRGRETGVVQYRVTIPKKIVRDLGLKKGQPLFILVEEEKIIIRPPSHLPRSHEYTHAT